jgi:hypothetical protein
MFGYDGWAELIPNIPITPAVACETDTGMVSADGVKKNIVHAYMQTMHSSPTPNYRY